MNLLNNIKAKRALATLIIAQNLNILRHTADRIAFMYLGRVVEIGPVGQVMERPAHSYTPALMSASPEPDPTVRRKPIVLQGGTPALNARPSGCEFHLRCPVARADCATRVPILSSRGGGAVSCHYPLNEGP